MTVALLRKELARSRGCPVCLATVQPSSVFGSPEVLIDRGAAAMARLTAKFVDEIANAVAGKHNPKSIRSAVARVGKQFDTKRVARVVQDELLRGLMLGALDAHHETATGDAVAPVAFAETDKTFVKHPMDEAVRAFRKRQVVTPEVFAGMTGAARKSSFAIAGLANTAMLDTVKNELANAIKEGADLRNFKSFVKTRLESSGWTPKNKSHVETIFRTNIQSAYNSGRYQQMSQPDVLALRPYWQVLTPNDGPPRQRKNHQAAHLLVFDAADPVFPDAFPPWDYNCRCRMRSLSKRQLGDGAVTPGSWFAAHDLPAPGFGGGEGAGLMFAPPTETSPAAAEVLTPEVLELPPVERPETTFDLPANPIEDLEGVARLRGADDLPEPMQTAVADGLSRAGMGTLNVPDVNLHFFADEASWIEAHPKDPKAAGLYNIPGKAVHVRPRTGNKLKQKIDGVWNIADAAKTPEEYLATTAVHEWGHHAHLTGGAKIDKVILDAYDKALPKKPTPGFPVFDPQGCPSLYGATNHMEFFSESFAAYHSDRAWLKKAKPIAFEMVETVIGMLK